MKNCITFLPLFLAISLYSQELRFNKIENVPYTKKWTVIYNQRSEVVGKLLNPNLPSDEPMDNTVIELVSGKYIEIPRCLCGAKDIMVNEKLGIVGVLSQIVPENAVIPKEMYNFSEINFLYIYDFNGKEIFKSKAPVIAGFSRRNTLTDDGHIYVAGVANNKKVLLRKFGIDGKLKWDKEIKDISIKGISSTPNSQFIILNQGMYEEVHSEKANNVITIYDSDGTVINESSTVEIYNNIIITDNNRFLGYSRKNISEFLMSDDELKVNRLELKLDSEYIYKLVDVPSKDAVFIIKGNGTVDLIKNIYSPLNTVKTVSSSLIDDFREIYHVEMSRNDRLVVYGIKTISYFEIVY